MNTRKTETYTASSYGEAASWIVSAKLQYRHRNPLTNMIPLTGNKYECSVEFDYDPEYFKTKTENLT